MRASWPAPTTPTTGKVTDRGYRSCSLSRSVEVALRRNPLQQQGSGRPGRRLGRGVALLVAMLIAVLGLPTAIAQTSASAASTPTRVTPATNPDLASGCGL